MKYLFLLSLFASSPSWAFFNSSSSASATATVVNNDFNQSLSDLSLNKLTTCFLENQTSCTIPLSSENALLIKDYLRLSTSFKVKTTSSGLLVFIGDAFLCEKSLSQKINLPVIENVVQNKSYKTSIFSRKNYAELCIWKKETSLNLVSLFKNDMKKETFIKIHSAIKNLEGNRFLLAQRSKKQFFVNVFFPNIFSNSFNDIRFIPESVIVSLPDFLPSRTTTSAAKTSSY